MKTRFINAVLLLAVLGLFPGRSNPSSQPNGDYGGAAKPLLPTKGWDCGMPGGIPVPEHGVPVFEAVVELEAIHTVGPTPYGLRKVLVTRGGTFAGPKISGTVMAGGLDFELGFTNGALEVEQVMVLKTSEGKFIYVRTAGTAADVRDVRIVPDFEAPSAGNHAWLNTGRYVGRRGVDLAAKTMKLAVYDVSGVVVETDPARILAVAKPSGLLDQPWDYRVAAPGEQRGEQLIAELVTLGGSQSVGATKGGGRNIIPITGGTVSGKINGKVLFGGADYQKLGNPFTLDARYLWQTDEGDVIIVRNAGPVSRLVPAFEVRSDSKQAWLNRGTYLSSGPGMGAGGVSLTFYQTAP